MLTVIKRLLSKEDGAVTVDWVLLTASLVIICLALLSQLGTAVGALSTSTATGIVNVKTTVTPK
jgi:Flp pilus assembly pilin Flp